MLQRKMKTYLTSTFLKGKAEDFLKVNSDANVVEAALGKEHRSGNSKKAGMDLTGVWQ